MSTHARHRLVRTLFLSIIVCLASLALWSVDRRARASAVANSFAFASPGDTTQNITQTDNYRITVRGADGGNNYFGRGGSGATVAATFTLQVGDVVTVVTGIAGGSGFGGSGGGGGSAVILTRNGVSTLLVVAGGGGGTGFTHGGGGNSAQGTAGGGSSGGTGAAGGGGGFNAAGGDAELGGGGGRAGALSGGGAGGSAGYYGPAPGGGGYGFGGGGGGSNGCGGGGGGYGGGYGAGCGGGGGGSSYVAASGTNITRTDGAYGGSNDQNGSVTVVPPDTTAPDTSITGTPSNPSNSATATFSFTGTDNVTAPANLSFECSLDNAAFTSCASPKTYTGLTNGSHNVSVRAKDAAGNVDQSPASYTWTVDTTPPDTNINTAPPVVSNSNSAAFAFSGTDNTGVTGYECSLDSASFAACSSGQSFANLSEGQHSFAVRAKDAAGNVDPTPASFTWTIDRTAPELVLNTGATNPTNAAFTVTANFSEGVTGFTLSDISVSNGAASNLTGSGSSYTFTVTPESPGEVRVNVPANAAQDAGGNGNTASNEIVVSFNNVSTLVVTKTADTDDKVCSASDCSLREAIGVASSGNTITFASPLFDSPQTVTLTLGELIIANKTLTIVGKGANLTSVSGNNQSRVFFVGPQANVTLNNVTVTGGIADGSNGTAGAGIYNNGTMTLNNCTVSGNSVAGNGVGAGITNSTGTLTVMNSTISGNSAPGGGGGIFNDIGTVTITNSTVSGNSATGNGTNSSINGGGILNNSGGNVTLTNSTISGNSVSNGATTIGGGLSNLGTVTLTNSTVSGNSASGGDGGGIGGGIHNNGTVNARNTILAGNTSGTGPDFFGTLTSQGNNLIGNTANMSGTIASDITNQNARLLPLGNYGGSTQTHALLIDSPALDAGDNTAATAAGLTTDQRGTGFSRILDSADPDTVQTIDIGAYEADPTVEDISDKTTVENVPLPQFSFNVGDAATAFDSITAAATTNPGLIAAITVGPGADSSKRTLDITPTTNQSGTATITVTVTKTVNGTPLSMTDTFVLTVEDVNTPPTANDDGLSSVAEDSGQRTISIADLLSNDTPGPVDESGQTLVFAGVSNPLGGTVTADATNVYFTPTADFNGVASFQYTVTDNGTTGGAADPKTSAPGTVSFAITEINDLPTASNDGLSNVAEDSGVRTISFTDMTGNDSAGPGNESGQTLTVKTVSNPVGGTVLINGTNVEFTPTADFNGAASFDYTVEDNGTTNGVADPLTSLTSATVSFIITEVNDAPASAADSLSSIAEDSGVRTIPFTDLTANDNKGAAADESAQTLIVRTVSNPVGGTVAINGSNVEFTPLANYNGAASFDYTVEDNGTTNGAAEPLTSSAPATASFSITEVNDAPAASSDSLSTVPEDTGVRVIPFTDLTGNDSTGPADEAAQLLIVKTVSNPVGGTVIINGANIEFTPSANYTGVASFDYTIEDNGTTGGASDPLVSAAAATASFTIDPVNDAPSFTKGPDQTASGNNPQTVPNWATNILAGPPDEAGQALSFVVSNNNNALFSVQPSIDPSGTLTFTSIAGVNGTATVTVELRDNGGMLSGGQDTSPQQTFLINISPTGWTTTADSGATEDESNPARPTYTNFTASPISGTPAGTYVLRYNITAVGNLTSQGAANTRLRVRFRDEGAGSRVVVAIVRSPITGGAIALGTLFDSDTFAPGSGFQMQEILMPALLFDFSQNTYWLEVRLIKTDSADQPGLGLVQINQQ